MLLEESVMWPIPMATQFVLDTPNPPAPHPERPRLIVLTDISSLTAGAAEPDDGQSLIRLMLYADEFDIEGLIATSNLGHRQTTRPDLIRRIVDAHARVGGPTVVFTPGDPSARQFDDERGPPP
jgi:hypothetical protein